MPRTSKPIIEQKYAKEILFLVRLFRLLKPRSHLPRMLGGSFDGIRKMAYALVNEGYLHLVNEWEQKTNQGRVESVLGMTSKGAKIVEQEYGIAATKSRFKQNNRQKSLSGFDKHELLIADTMAAIMASARNHADVRFIGPKEFFDYKGVPDDARRRFYNASTSSKKPYEHMYHLVVDRVRYKEKFYNELWITFDFIFGIERRNSKGKLVRRFYYLEAGRGNLKSRVPELTYASYTKKYLAYQKAIVNDHSGTCPNKRFFGIRQINPVFLITNRDPLYPGTERMLNCMCIPTISYTNVM